MLDMQLLPGAIFEILASAMKTRQLSLCDRYGLMAASMDDNLDEEERETVNRILWAVSRGKIQFTPV
ncbi:MAG: hypothetical protein J7647_12035 [Cyanobacteria bacterium SBLK]|nr:hypothetical protein [Cyanobacteria bacterium SBLK]